MAHDQEAVGSNPDTIYWMDVSIASYYIKFIHKNNENTGGQMGHTKKYFKKQTCYLEKIIFIPEENNHGT
jgi:hypothetical protein